ncbi:MAG: hypothetical protein AVDCRST_MAG71-2976 [uncultured Lysobacter sp.]|uniref:DUF4124 domain-containing protein n=1 Tax=uncultured Lysobacter sp. TaxID=271060 RepID=A0A6J4MDA8_9GAMM|nr:MAG: hypothetical protein AVDCRST_MAG71-2976 [uncultured Lysobacter sp.]
MIRVPRRVSLCLLAGLALGLLALPATAGRVYQWKDARGVTHYTDLPPPNQSHTTRQVGQKSAAAAQPVVNADCSNARANLTILQGTAPVGPDMDRDGKPDSEYTAVQRAERAKFALADVERLCSAAMDKRG